LAAVTDLSDEQKRHMVADLCRLIGSRLKSEHAAGTPIPTAATRSVKLSPRMRQTLQQLLRGDSEKQAARALGVSPHTVHVYVKAIYRKFNVASRGELLARFVRA
jgi:DNA-binding CsgD family transcriptional regulator